MKLRPGKVGLYDPAYEHDACGVGFIAHVRGERSHRLMQQAAHMLTRMDHRGACGCEPNSGDGAGMLTALPHALLRRVAADEFGAELGAPGTFSAGVFFLPQDDGERELCRRVVEEIVAERGQELIGWRKVPTRPEVADIGATALDSMPIIEQLFIRRRRRTRPGRLRTRALPDPQAGDDPPARQRSPRRSADVLRLFAVDPRDHLQGHADLRPARAVLPRSRGAGLRVPPGDGPLPIRHEHVPVLGPRAAEPLHEPQRRDQHAARQHELDARPRGSSPERPLRRRSAACLPGRRARLLGLRQLRQRARVPAAHGPHPPGGGHDDDPGGVAERHAHGRHEEGVLRLPLLPDGAVGRTGLDRLHRRPIHRRGARPQRPSPQPLLRHRRRPGHHGVGGRRRPGRAGTGAAQGAAQARPDVPGRLRPRPHRRRRRAEERHRLAAAVRGVARTPHRPGRPGRPCRKQRERPREPGGHGRRHPDPEASRPSATPARRCASCCGP